MTIRVRALEPADWDAVQTVYREGIATGHATFEAEPPDWETFTRTRIDSPRLVATRDNTIVGWAAATPVSTRDVYRGVIEHSIYVTASARGHRIGATLLDAFITAPTRLATGRSNPASSPRTPPHSHSTNEPASDASAIANASPS